MKADSSRRHFLAAGLAVPVAGMANTPEPRAAAPDATGLRYRTLGKTGLKVTTVGYGCMITSDPSVITRAAELGINYFDTARSYQNGNNERMVGAALKGRRDKITLSSKSDAKIGMQALAELNTSLRELGTDHLDIWYMHMRDTPDTITDELVTAWEKAKQEGKVLHIGVSTHKPNAIVDRVLEVGKFEVVLSTYSFAVGTANDPAYKKLSEAGIGMVAMKVMAPAVRQYGFKIEGKERTKEPGGPLAALKWVLQNTRMATTIPSMTDMEQLETNFRAMAEPYGAADEKLLARIDEQIRPLYCRMCDQCSGQCPKGVMIPEMIRSLAYADFYGQFALGRERFLALPEEARLVRCSNCGSCQVHCPNGVHVQERLTRAQELFG